MTSCTSRLANRKWPSAPLERSGATPHNQVGAVRPMNGPLDCTEIDALLAHIPQRASARSFDTVSVAACRTTSSTSSSVVMRPSLKLIDCGQARLTRTMALATPTCRPIPMTPHVERPQDLIQDLVQRQGRRRSAPATTQVWHGKLFELRFAQFRRNNLPTRLIRHSMRSKIWTLADFHLAHRNPGLGGARRKFDHSKNPRPVDN